MNPIKMPSVEEVKNVLDYDSETGIFTWKINRGGVAKAGTIAGSTRKDGYYQICINGTSYKTNRLAWLYMTGNDPLELDIDHIDCDRANNKFSNLRVASGSQNCANRNKRSDNKSGYKGVYKMGNKWASSITCNKIRKFLGMFDTPLNAYNAYIEASKKYHGEFSNLHKVNQ